MNMSSARYKKKAKIEKMSQHCMETKHQMQSMPAVLFGVALALVLFAMLWMLFISSVTKKNEVLHLSSDIFVVKRAHSTPDIVGAIVAIFAQEMTASHLGDVQWWSKTGSRSRAFRYERSVLPHNSLYSLSSVHSTKKNTLEYYDHSLPPPPVWGPLQPDAIKIVSKVHSSQKIK